ncbi:hypothetical protein LQ567_24630 [Niabella pedocola]|uniref:Uncharacterized protein n=1 Tax=Niabella pedocola TaxID=1752077 RepID=A0ABS8Q053_9BACT|nr:hypothetical protein [Niabella pedocola]MCD2425993.1 hypothetical protein [Niabella pedocola]
MSIQKEASPTGSNCIEVEYFFEEATHLMDALIQNKCEYELLALIREVASRLKLRVIIETAPQPEKGFKRRFRVALKKETKTATAAVTIATAALVAVVAAPLSVAAGDNARKLIEQLMEAPEFMPADNERLRLQTEKLKLQLMASCANLDTSNVIKKRRSNFFELLTRYPKINGVRFTALEEHQATATQEQQLSRPQFGTYILTTNVLEPEEIDDVDIEIISPVLKKSSYKWTGMYQGRPRSFSMQSKEFKKLVQSGKVQFKNGTSINCQLTIHKKMNNEGTERITGIDITRVNHYFENDKPVETVEGKKQKKQPEPEITQLALFM